MAFAAYKQLAPPSAVEHAVFAKLGGSDGNTNLVVARTSVLDVFDVDNHSVRGSARGDVGFGPWHACRMRATAGCVGPPPLSC